MATPNCDVENKIAASHVVLSNIGISDEIKRLSTEINAVERNIARETDDGIKQALSNRKQVFEDELEFLVTASILREDFGIVQKSSLLRKMKRAGGSQASAVKVLEALDKLPTIMNQAGLSTVLMNMGIGEDIVLNATTSLGSVRSGVINTIATDAVLRKRYKFPAQWSKAVKAGVDDIDIQAIRDDLTKEQAFKQNAELVAEPENNRYVNNYIILKAFVSPDTEFTSAELKKLIDTLKKQNAWKKKSGDFVITVDDIAKIKNNLKGFQEFEEMLFLHGDAFKEDGLREAAIEKLNAIKSQASPGVNDVIATINKYKDFIDDAEAFKTAVSKSYVYNQAVGMGHRVRNGESFMRDDIINFLRGEKSEIRWKSKDIVQGKPVDTEWTPTPLEAIHLLGTEELQRIGLDPVTVKNILKIEPEAGEELIKKGLKLTPEQNAIEQQTLIDWINSNKPKPTSENLHTRLFSYVTGRSVDDMNSVIYFDDFANRVKPSNRDLDRAPIFEALFDQNTALISNTKIKNTDKIAKLEAEINKFIKENDGAIPTIVVRDSRMQTDPRITALKRKYGDKLHVIAPSGQLDLNLIVKGDKLYVAARSPERLAEITDVFESIGDEVNIGKFGEGFDISDAENKYLLARYGQNGTEAYNQEMRRFFGDISPAEANNILNSLANESSYYPQLVDFDSVIANIDSMSQQDLLDEIDALASSYGIELPAGTRIDFEDIDNVRRAYFNYKYTPLDVADSQSIANKRDAINYLLGQGGYKGGPDIGSYYMGSQFNLALQEAGYRPPTDGLRDFLEKTKDDAIDTDDNFLRAFIKKYEKNPKFLRETGETNFEKAKNVLQRAYDDTSKRLGGQPTTTFDYKVGRGLALVDVTDRLTDLRKQIADYVQTGRKPGRINYTQIQKMGNDLYDSYEKEIVEAVENKASFDEIDKIRNTYITKITEFERDVLQKDMGPYFNTQDRKQWFVYNKGNIFSVYEAKQLPDLLKKIEAGKQKLADAIEETKKRVAAKGRGELRTEFGVETYTLKNGDTISVDEKDIILAQADRLPDGHPLKGIFDEENIDSLARTEQKQLGSYFAADNSLRANIDGVMKMFYEKIGPLIKKLRFFENYRLVNMPGGGSMPYAIYQMDLTPPMLKLGDFRKYSLETKQLIFDGVKEAIGDGRWTANMATNREVIDDIVDGIINTQLDRAGVAFTAEQVDNLKAQFSNAFAVYGDLVPLSQNIVNRLQSRVPAIPEGFEDIVTKTSVSPTTTINTPADITMSQYLDEAKTPVSDIVAVPESEIEKIDQQFFDSYDYMIDFKKNLDMLSDDMSKTLFASARDLYGRHMRPNAIATAVDAQNGTTIKGNLESSMDSVETLVSKFLYKGVVDVRAALRGLGIEQPTTFLKMDTLKDAQKILVDNNYMGMTDDVFDSIAREEITDKAELMAYDVADYFRNLRNVWNLSEDGSTGLTLSAKLNRDLYNLHESFLKIGKNADGTDNAQNFIRDYYSFKNAVKQDQFFKFGLSANPKDEFWTKYRDVIKNDSLGVSYANSEIGSDFAKEFNALMGSNYTPEEVAKISAHLFGLRLHNFFNNRFFQVLRDIGNFIAVPISRMAVKFGYNVLSSMAQAPSWILRNQAIRNGISDSELKKVREFRRSENLLGELGDLSDLTSRKPVDDILSSAKVNSADDASTRAVKLSSGINPRGKALRTVDWITGQGNNTQEFLASALSKDVALYRAMQENAYRPFGTVDEFMEFMRTAPVSQRNRVLNEVTANAQKVYSDVMGMGFGSIDSFTPIGALEQIGSAIYASQSYMAGRGANVMKTLFDNVHRLFKADGYVAKNGYSPEAISNAYEYLRNSRQFVDLAETIYGDVRNAMRLVRFVRNGEDDEDWTFEDLMDAFGIVSVYMQAANVLFKPIFAGIESASDAAASNAQDGRDYRSDVFGVGAFTRSFVSNMFRQAKFAEGSLSLAEGFIRNGPEGFFEAMSELIFGAADGTLKYMVGGDLNEWGFQSERYSRGFLPAAFAQQNTQNQDMLYRFQSMNDTTWELMKNGHVGAAIWNNMTSNKAYTFLRDSGELVNLQLAMLGLFGEEAQKNATKDFYSDVDVITDKMLSLPEMRAYFTNGILFPTNNIDIEEQAKEYIPIGGPGTSKFVEAIDNFLDTGSYVYDGPEYRVNPVYESLLKAIPEAKLREIRNIVNKEVNSKSRRILSATLMDQAVDQMHADGLDQGRYAEWKALTQAGAFAVQYDTSDDGSKMSPEAKEMQRANYMRSIQPQLAGLSRDAYLRYATRKAARDNAQDETVQQYLRWDADKNKYNMPANIRKQVEKADAFKQNLDEGDVQGALAVFSPLAASFNKKDTEDKLAFVALVTNTMNYIDQVNGLTEDQKLNFKAETLRPVMDNIPEAFDSLIQEGGGEFDEVYEAFLGTMYNAESFFTDALRDQDTSGSGASPKLKKIASMKTDLSKWIDKYRDAAIGAKRGIMATPGKSITNSITPEMLELIKLAKPPKLNAKEAGLTLASLPKITDKDINRRIKPRKEPKFKVPKT